MKVLDDVKAGANISRCGVYRYTLTRDWAPQRPGGRVLWIMLNPSTATAEEDDPTIRRCQSFAREWDYSGIAVVNLFAYRATDPTTLADAAGAGVDPVGPTNDEVIRFWAGAPGIGLVMFAWGGHKAVGSRGLIVEELVAEEGATSYCLGRTKAGRPRHPLYVPGSVGPLVWRQTP